MENLAQRRLDRGFGDRDAVAEERKEKEKMTLWMSRVFEEIRL